MTRTPIMLSLILLIAMTLTAGCGVKDKTGPGEVRWDRDICARCVMAVSDHEFSAQVRGGPTGRNTKLYFFDDIGCAVLWLAEQPWRKNERTEIWVTDWRDGSWIDARTAWYVDGKTTPMDFGLGAQPEQAENALNYGQAIAHINNRNQKAH